MKKIKVFIMLVFSTLSYSAGSIGDKGEENSSEIESVKVEELEKIKIPTNNSEIKKIPVKERGIDIMNFYIPVKENNKFTTFGEFDHRFNKDIYQWTLGEGYININNAWDFNYKIEREYHKEKKGEKLSSYVWDNEISFVRLNRGFKIGNQPINYRSIIGVKHSETDTKLSKRNADYKFYIGQRLSAFFSNVGGWNIR